MGPRPGADLSPGPTGEGRAAPGLPCDARRPGAGRAVRLSRGPGDAAPVRIRGPRADAGRRDAPSGVALVGDIADGHLGGLEGRLADRRRERPDLLVVTGDIVYSQGRISEYSARFFPVYNADAASPDQGAPVLRTTLSVAAPGNHDTATRDLGSVPDGLAYFLAWSQPLNGPLGDSEGPNVPSLIGPPGRCAAYRAAAGPTFPRMANFSFDCGDVHWTVLDANNYVDWTNREPRGLRVASVTSPRPRRAFVAARGVPPAGVQLVARPLPAGAADAAPGRRLRAAAASWSPSAGTSISTSAPSSLTFKVRPRPDGRMQSPDNGASKANGRSTTSTTTGP